MRLEIRKACDDWYGAELQSGAGEGRGDVVEVAGPSGATQSTSPSPCTATSPRASSACTSTRICSICAVRDGISRCETGACRRVLCAPCALLCSGCWTTTCPYCRCVCPEDDAQGELPVRDLGIPAKPASPRCAECRRAFPVPEWRCAECGALLHQACLASHDEVCQDSELLRPGAGGPVPAPLAAALPARLRRPPSSHESRRPPSSHGSSCICDDCLDYRDDRDYELGDLDGVVSDDGSGPFVVRDAGQLNPGLDDGSFDGQEGQPFCAPSVFRHADLTKASDCVRDEPSIAKEQYKARARAPTVHRPADSFPAQPGLDFEAAPVGAIRVSTLSDPAAARRPAAAASSGPVEASPGKGRGKDKKGKKGNRPTEPGAPEEA